MRAGTIVASNYVEMAKVLGESYVRHHPDNRFVILVVDDGDVGVLPAGVSAQRLDDLDLTSSESALMRTIYDVMEFSTAVKASFLRGLLEHDDAACYLDPDIFVYGGFGDLLEATAGAGIVLTPHVLDPIPRDGRDPSEAMIMLSGIFNLGFIAVGRSALPFLDWWHERLVTDAIVDIESALFTDQRWIDWVPALFDYQRCNDRGMNVAWWNVHERDVRLDDGAADSDGPRRATANGEPIRFVHFSGYDPLQPGTLSKHQFPTPRTAHDPGIGIRRLAEDYGRLLQEAGHLERRAEPYGWAVSEHGVPLTPGVRRLVRDAAKDEMAGGAAIDALSTPLAFGESSDRLRSWLETDDGGPEGLPVSRAERALWRSRDDLRRAFPDIDGPDARSYREWLRAEPAARSALGDLRPAVADDVQLDPMSEAGLVLRTRSYLGRGARGVRSLTRR